MILILIYYALKLELKRLQKAQRSQTKFLTMPILIQHFIALRFVESEQSTVCKNIKILDKKSPFNNRDPTPNWKRWRKRCMTTRFVQQFDFPDANGKPHKTSAGRWSITYTETGIPGGLECNKYWFSYCKTVLGGTSHRQKMMIIGKMREYPSLVPAGNSIFSCCII